MKKSFSRPLDSVMTSQITHQIKNNGLNISKSQEKNHSRPLDSGIDSDNTYIMTLKLPKN